MSDTDTKTEAKPQRREYTLQKPIIDGGKEKAAGEKVLLSPAQAKNLQDQGCL